MSVLGMDPAKFPAPVKALYNRIAARAPSQGRRLRRSVLALAQPSGAGRTGRGARLLSEIRRRAAAGLLSVHRAKRRAGDWRRLRVARSCAACAGRRIAAGHHRRHRRALEQDLPHPYELLRDIMSKTLAWQPIPDALQAQAVAEWGKDGLVEIVVISGFYQMFAAINQGFDIVPSGKGPPPATT